jgi:hypothetical protein
VTAVAERAAGAHNDVSPLDRLGRLVLRRPVVIVATLVVPLAALLVAMHRERWFPAGDLAQAELHVRGFFRHPPLVGAAGRIGTLERQGSHPGPSMWLALLPTYLVFGRSAYGLMVAMVVLHTASVTAAVWLARKIGGAALAIATFGALVVALHAAGPQFLVQPWNPWAAIVPFVVFLLLVTRVVEGHLRSAPWAVLVGSHCVQSHVGYALLVGGLLAGALVVVIVRWRHEVRREAVGTSSPILPILWSVGALAVAWLPPVVDQLRRDPGNLRILWDHFGDPDEPSVGLWAAIKAFAGEFNVVGGWLTGPRQPTETPFWPGFLLMVAAFVAAFVLNIRRRREPLIALQGVVSAAALIGIVSIARVFGDFYDYVIRWTWMITVAAAATILTTMWRELRTVRVRSIEPRMARAALACAGAVAVAIAATAMTVNDATADIPARRDSRLIGGVSPAVADALDPAGRYLVRWHDPMSLGGVGFGMLLELERRGYTAGVDQWGSAAALPHRVMPEETASDVLWVVTGVKPIADFRARADAVELGWFDQRTPAEQERSAQLRAQLEARLAEVGRAELIATIDTQYGIAPLVIGNVGVPQDVKDLAGAYDDLREPIAVFKVPPFSPLYP